MRKKVPLKGNQSKEGGGDQEKLWRDGQKNTKRQNKRQTNVLNGGDQGAEGEKKYIRWDSELFWRGLSIGEGMGSKVPGRNSSQRGNL